MTCEDLTGRLLWLAASVCTASAACAQPIIVDGTFEDWPADAEPIATDPAGDSASDAFDITRVHAIGEASTLWLRFDLARAVNLQSGEESDGDLRLLVGPEGGPTLEIDFRERELRFDDGGSGREVPWSGYDFRAAPTHAAEEFELRMDLSSLGIRPGDVVTIQFAGADELDEPVHVRTGQTRTDSPRPDFEFERTGASARIVSYNTLRGGLSKHETRPVMARLLGLIDADVYCFQEEERTSTPQIRSILMDATESDQQEWTILRSDGGCVLASRLPLAPVRTFNNRYAAGIVDAGEAGEMLVISVHLKCCGHAGSKEDRQRMQQIGDIARTVRAARDQTENTDLPVVIVGDWNLVGSRDPLTAAEDRLDAERVLLRHIDSDETYTWYSEGGSFWPGQLDLVVVSSELSDRASGGILDSRRLSQRNLGESGLLRNDSAVSDHMILFVDIAPAGE